MVSCRLVVGIQGDDLALGEHVGSVVVVEAMDEDLDGECLGVGFLAASGVQRDKETDSS